jgi:hypothetical protein
LLLNININYLLYMKNLPRKKSLQLMQGITYQVIVVVVAACPPVVVAAVAVAAWPLVVLVAAVTSPCSYLNKETVTYNPPVYKSPAKLQ